MKSLNFRKSNVINNPQKDKIALSFNSAGVLTQTNEAGVSTPVVPAVTKKVYKALLTQTGTDAPTAEILENTLAEVPTLGYSVQGTFSITAVGKFTNKKTVLSIQNGNNASASAIYSIHYLDSDTVIITTETLAGVGTDNILIDTAVTIEVYD